MTTLREAAQRALDALEDLADCGTEAWSEQRPCVQIGREAITALRAALAQQEEPMQEQVIEDAIEAAYWHFDARKKGLNEWASAPQSERDAFKAEARKLVRGYFPTRQAQDTKREMLAVADAFIRGKRAALAQQDAPNAHGYASRLAFAIWNKHYKDIAPQWKPLDDLMGVLTQIDNMTSGLTRLAQQAEPVEPAAVVATQSDVWRGYNGQWAPPGKPIKMVQMLRDLPTGTLLYLAPPQRVAQQAEPAQEQAEPLTIERLRYALVASRIIPPAAVEDPDEYDDGVTLHRIEALHRRLT